MKLKTLASVIAAGFALAAVDTASACNYSLWVPDSGSGTVNTGGVATDTTGTPATATLVAGRPTVAGTGEGQPRYSGACSSLSKEPGNYVVDGSPQDETTFRFRFYVRATPTTGSTVVYRARETAGTDMITVTWNGTGFVFNTNGGGTATVGSLTAGRWYSVEGNWAQNAAMTVTVQGNGSNTPANATLNAAAGAADNIDSAELGWISGGTGASGDVFTDAYEARRTNPIGRLCRGNANTNGGSANQRDIFDITTIIAEINNQARSGNQPDATENGVIDIFDVTTVVAIINSSPAC